MIKKQINNDKSRDQQHDKGQLVIKASHMWYAYMICN